MRGKSILAAVGVIGVLSAAAPAFASNATITLRNTSSTATFTKSFENVCSVVSDPAAATLAPGTSDTFITNCLTGSAGGWRFNSGTKQCSFNWSAIRQTSGLFAFSSSATSTGSTPATCRNIIGSRNINTGNMTNTFEMQ